MLLLSSSAYCPPILAKAPTAIYDFRERPHHIVRNPDYGKKIIGPQGKWISEVSEVSTAGQVITAKQMHALLTRIDSNTCRSTFSWYSKCPVISRLSNPALTAKQLKKHEREDFILMPNDYAKLKELAGLSDADSKSIQKDQPHARVKSK